MTIRFKCSGCNAEADARDENGIVLPPFGWAESIQFAKIEPGVPQAGMCTPCVDRDMPELRIPQMVRKLHGQKPGENSAESDRTRAVLSAADNLLKRFTKYVQPEDLDAWRYLTRQDYDVLLSLLATDPAVEPGA